MNISEKEVIFLNLKRKLEAFIDNGLDISKDLNRKDRIFLLKKSVDELLDKAANNLLASGDFDEIEMKAKKAELREYVQNYCESVICNKKLK